MNNLVAIKPFRMCTNLCESLENTTKKLLYLHLFLQIYELLMQFMERRRSLRLVAMLLRSNFLLVEQVGQEPQDTEHIVTLPYVLQTQSISAARNHGFEILACQKFPKMMK